MKISLKTKITNYFKSRPRQFINKGIICNAMNEYLGETTGRHLRTLVTKGILEVRKGQGCNEYRLYKKLEQQELYPESKTTTRISDNLITLFD